MQNGGIGTGTKQMHILGAHQVPECSDMPSHPGPGCPQCLFWGWAARWQHVLKCLLSKSPEAKHQSACILRGRNWWGFANVRGLGNSAPYHAYLLGDSRSGSTSAPYWTSFGCIRSGTGGVRRQACGRSQGLIFTFSMVQSFLHLTHTPWVHTQFTNGGSCIWYLTPGDNV